MRYAKAITAFIVALLTIVVGDGLVDTDVATIHAAVVGVLTAAGVAIIPNSEETKHDRQR